LIPRKKTAFAVFLFRPSTTGVNEREALADGLFL